MDPISRSTNGFCQGDRAAVTTASVPMPLIVAPNFSSENRISIADQIARRFLPGKSFSKLLHGPLLRRVFSYVPVQYASHLRSAGKVQRRQRLGGMLNYYCRAAA